MNAIRKYEPFESKAASSDELAGLSFLDRVRTAGTLHNGEYTVSYKKLLFGEERFSLTCNGKPVHNLATALRCISATAKPFWLYDVTEHMYDESLAQVIEPDPDKWLVTDRGLSDVFPEFGIYEPDYVDRSGWAYDILGNRTRIQ